MSASKKFSKIPLLLVLLFFICRLSSASENKTGPEFKIIAFFTGKNDAAHVSYVHEANTWFAEMAGKHNFRYDSTNNWDKWEYDLRDNPDIKILLSVDPISFPLGTGPKPHEIWHSGYYPVVWCNTDYKMIYINMGHNIIDYENKTSRELSQTFNNKTQNKLIIDALFWLGKRVNH